MAKGLTAKQERILNYVMEYIHKEGYPPSIREIGKNFGIGSLRGVTVHLDALQRKGYISRSNMPRSIKLIHPMYQPSNRSMMVPLVGTIAAGVPINADEQVEDMVPVPADLLRGVKDAFLLRVKGDSMTGDGILPRDLVLIRPQAYANHNDLVAVLIGDEATVKRLHKGGNETKLMPSNPAYEPIEIRSEDARVIGLVIGLLRDYTGQAF